MDEKAKNLVGMLFDLDGIVELNLNSTRKGIRGYLIVKDPPVEVIDQIILSGFRLDRKWKDSETLKFCFAMKKPQN